MKPLYLVYDVGADVVSDLSRALAAACSAGTHLRLPDDSGDDARTLAEQAVRAVRALSVQEFDKLQIVSGPGVHSDLARFASERRVREAVFVPHPADRVAPPPGSGKGVVDAFADRLRIARTRRAIDDVLDAIASFWLVGPVERCGFLSKFIFDALHVTAPELTARPQAPIDPSLRQDIERRHAADYVLYTASQLLEQRSLLRLVSPADRPDWTES